MVEMTRPTAFSLPAPEFNEFLFAPIGPDRNGMLLSVLSALARLDLDPWQEARNLARLSEAKAAERLASLITALPRSARADQDPGTIAARLIALLPRRVDSNFRSPETLLGVGAALNSPTVKCLIFCAIILVMTLVSQFMITSDGPPAGTAGAHPPTTRAISAQVPPRSSH